MVALRLPQEEIEKVETSLKESGLKPRKVKNTLWSYEGKGIYFNMYPSGTLLIQGKDAEGWASKVLGVIEYPRFPLAGCDEVGKGDIFGPLVLCCAVIPPENFKKVLLLNPKDSKLLKDEDIMKKAQELRKLVKVKCITLMPERFNELYKKYRNINRLMDDAYKKLIDEVSREFNPGRIVVDRYSSRNPFQSYSRVEFIEKGERDIAVSVASMLAREKYLTKLKELEKDNNIEIPKGAGSHVREFANQLKRKNPTLAQRLIKIYEDVTQS
ncbi:ribonuclease HIII [Hydrogenivirga caldilitoris]|uniref:Ribonuclease n=1 Tax=Hydrogenivirga caldilitoris TaxID=246264 RepID=A0A497XN20_9AQUI|nr:ribonuclease HIII [Hydrogenivirga caldilitoris]RLJ70337.1 ribonuclease HIII [Hydrogenivirga caldilitoris]